MAKFIIIILVLLSINLFLTDSLMCQENEHLIKIINETNSFVVSDSNSKKDDKEVVQRATDADLGIDNALNSGSTLDMSKGRHILLKDDPDHYKEKAELFRKSSEELDRKKIGQELYVVLLNAFKNCKVLTKNKAKNYIVYFNVKSTQHDEYTGTPYLWEVEYRIVKGGGVLFESHCLPPRKKMWFSNKEYHQLVEPKVIARQIVADLCKYF